MVEKKEELLEATAEESFASQDGNASNTTECSSKTVLAEHEIPCVTLIASASESASESIAAPALSRNNSDQSLGQIGDYDLIEELSTTPVARFYRAYSKTVQKDVAIKVIRPELCQDAALLKRFKQEAKAASEVDHPNLCSIYDFGVTEAGCAYVVTDFLQGSSLKDLIAREGFLDPERALEIFKQVCHGLSHLHEHNLVHRNLNPSNIFLVETESSHDFVKVVDFGIGRMVNATKSDGESAEPEAFAEPRYMSPEQLMGYKLDGRSDIYSIGLIMYEALCGKPAYGTQNRMQTMMKQLNAKPRSFRSMSSELEISEHLERIVFKCLEKNRSARYANVSDLCMELDLCPGYSLPYDKQARRSFRIGAASKGGSSKWSRPLVFIAIAAVTFGSMAGTYSFWKEWRRHNPPVWGRGGGFLPRHLRHVPHDVISRRADEAFNKGQYPEAIELYAQAINTFKRHKNVGDPLPGAKANVPELVTLYTQLGNAFMQKSYDLTSSLERPAAAAAAPYTDPTDYRNAEDAYLNAMKFHDYPYGVRDVDLLSGLGQMKYLLKDYVGAIQAHQMYLDVLKSAPDPLMEVTSLNNIGQNYMQMGKFSEAEKYFRQALEVSKKNEAIQTVRDSIASIAVDVPKALLAQGKYGKAEWWAKQNINAIMDSQPSKGIVTTDQEALRKNYESLVESYKKRGKISEAEKALLMVHSLE